MAKRIFICFSDFGGRKIATHVYDYCKERLGYDKVFLSSEDIKPGENWRKKRDEALEECDFFVFIATSDVTTSGPVEYEIRKANKLKKKIIPCKDSSIDNWSEIEEKYDWDSMQYLPFDDKHDLINKLHPQIAVIPQQQQSPKQRVAEESMELRLRVKSYQCVFRFKPPKNVGGSASELTRDQFIENIDEWVINLKATATHAEDKSDDKEIVHLLTFSEGTVRISFGRERVDGDYGTEQRENEWYTGLTIESDNLDMIDRIVKEADRPYWVYRIILIDKLDRRYLKYQIEEKSGREITGSSEGFTKDTRTGQNISTGGHIEYPFGKLNKDAKIKAQISSAENADSVIQIWFISGTYDVGFYQAHNLFSPDKILSILLGDVTPSEVQRIIKEACSKPSK